jgi:hypothetical protein
MGRDKLVPPLFVMVEAVHRTAIAIEVNRRYQSAQADRNCAAATRPVVLSETLLMRG